MSDENSQKQKKLIERHMDENLKKVFSDYAQEEMPAEITDLLSLLKAQDQSAGRS